MNLGSCSQWVPRRDDGWGAHLIDPLPDEPGIHVLGEYLGEMMGRELIWFILYQMNLGFMFLVSTWERWWVGSSSNSSSTRWTWDSCSWWVPRRDDGWGAHLIHPLPDEPGIHVLGEYLGEMMGGELISFILYQMNLGFMFSVSTWERWWVGSSSHWSSTRWTWDSCSQWVLGRDVPWLACWVPYGTNTLWVNYIDGDRLGSGLEFGFQTKWQHCTMQNISHWTDSGSNPYSFFLHQTGIRVQVCTESVSGNVYEPYWNWTMACLHTEYEYLHTVPFKPFSVGIGPVDGVIRCGWGLWCLLAVRHRDGHRDRWFNTGTNGNLCWHLSRYRAVWTHHKTLIHTDRNWDRYRELYRMPLDTVAILSVSVLVVCLGFC